MTYVVVLILILLATWALPRPGVRLVLVDAGPSKIATIRALRELGGVGLLEAKRQAETGGVLQRTLDRAEAERWATLLRARGATVRLERGRCLPSRVRVGHAQRAAVLRGGGYVRLLGPGAHWLRPGERLRRLRLEDPRVPQALQAALLADPRAAAELERVEVGARERALLWDAGRLLAILDPGRHALWRAAGARVERLEVRPDGRVEHRALEALLQVALAGQLTCVEVGVGERGFLYADGVFVDELAPGRHLLWGGVAAFQLRRIEVRPHWVAAGRGLSAPCADRVPVGCELDLQLAAEDPRWAAEAAQDSEASLARQAEALLRAAIGRRPLAALLAEPQALEQALRPPLEEAAERLGWRLCDLAASVVALPEAVERAALRALEATEAARAERIRRREEAAATRSQLNTARMVASCPTLLRLKELEAAQGMASRARVLGVPAALGSRALGLLPRP